MIVPPRSSEPTCVIRAAGFMATSTLGWSPGVRMSREAKWIWKAETPWGVPAGARISAGGSGRGGRALSARAVASAEQPPAKLQPATHTAAQASPPPPEEIAALREGGVLVGFLQPLTATDTVRGLAEAKVTSFAMEAIPRITRAQSMDALSSQATVAGYRAGLMAAQQLGRFFPMLTTAAGTVRPATVMILGAGVAGLQAIATARRLGAVVQAFDVRAAVKEQIRSLGARFLTLDPGLEGAEAAGGYARQLTDEEQQRQRELLAEEIGQMDAVISTAAVPGRRAPLLVTAQAVKNMKPGSVVIDLAAETGGNCELTEAGETVVKEDV